MPKFLVIFHMALLGILSALVFGSTAGLLGTGGGMSRSSVVCLAWPAMGLGLVMVVTEVWSGVRWPAVIAFAATVVGLVALCGRAEAPAVSIWSWSVAWLAVATWFAVLAAKARSNR